MCTYLQRCYLAAANALVPTRIKHQVINLQQDNCWHSPVTFSNLHDRMGTLS